jgi:molybdopterin converting factor small subunit
MTKDPGMVRILLFATAREAVGRSVLAWRVPEEGMTASDLVHELGTEFPRLRPALRTSRFVRNDEYLEQLTQRVRPGDEFAVHPPYGGG